MKYAQFVKIRYFVKYNFINKEGHFDQ